MSTTPPHGSGHNFAILVWDVEINAPNLELEKFFIQHLVFYKQHAIQISQRPSIYDPLIQYLRGGDEEKDWPAALTLVDTVVLIDIYSSLASSEVGISSESSHSGLTLELMDFTPTPTVEVAVHDAQTSEVIGCFQDDNRENHQTNDTHFHRYVLRNLARNLALCVHVNDPWKFTWPPPLS